jgi:hypothetical protein
VRTTLCGALAQASSRRDAAEDALHEAVAAAEATLFPSQKKPAKRAKTTPKLKLEPDDQRGHVLRVTKAGAAAVRKASHVTLLATRRGGEVLFTTKDVARRASELLEASSACHAASAEILRECSKVAGTFRAPLRNAARLVGDVDALLALAECASQRAWTRPTVDGKALTIEGLRHPLVDEAVFFPASLFSVFLIRRLCPTKTPSTRLYAMSSSCLASGAAPLPRPVLAARDTSADAPQEPGPPLHHNQPLDFPCAIAGLRLHPFGRKARRRRRQEPVLARDRCGAASLF